MCLEQKLWEPLEGSCGWYSTWHPPEPLRRVTTCNRTAEALGGAIVKKDCTFLHSTSLLTSCKGSVLRMPVWEVLKGSNPLWSGCWRDFLCKDGLINVADQMRGCFIHISRSFSIWTHRIFPRWVGMTSPTKTRSVVSWVMKNFN